MGQKDVEREKPLLRDKVPRNLSSAGTLSPKP